MSRIVEILADDHTFRRAYNVEIAAEDGGSEATIEHMCRSYLDTKISPAEWVRFMLENLRDTGAARRAAGLSAPQTEARIWGTGKERKSRPKNPAKEEDQDKLTTSMQSYLKREGPSGWNMEL